MALSNLVTPVYNHWCFFLDGQIISFLQKKWRCLKKKKKKDTEPLDLMAESASFFLNASEATGYPRGPE